MVKIKTTKELIEEKEEFNVEIDQKIYDSVQRAGIKSRAEGAKRRAELQELEDKGWYRLHTIETPVVVEPEIEVIIEPKDEGIIKSTLLDGELRKEIARESQVDPEKEALKAQLEATKERLAMLEAAGKMEKPEEVEIVPEEVKTITEEE